MYLHDSAPFARTFRTYKCQASNLSFYTITLNSNDDWLGESIQYSGASGCSCMNFPIRTKEYRCTWNKTRHRVCFVMLAQHSCLLLLGFCRFYSEFLNNGECTNWVRLEVDVSRLAVSSHLSSVTCCTAIYG